MFLILQKGQTAADFMETRELSLEERKNIPVMNNLALLSCLFRDSR